VDIERARNAFRTIDLGRADVLTGICASEAIFLHAKHPATFLVFSPRKPSVSLGRFQIFDRGFPSVLKSEKLGFLRRPRGGGLLLHTPPQIVFCSIIVGDEEEARRFVLNGLLMILEQFGLTGRLDGLTGITVGGRRICEYTITSSANGFTEIFGVLLLNTDYSLMGRLTRTRTGLEHIEVRRIISLVTSIYHETAEVPNSKSVRDALISSVSLSGGIKPSKGRLDMAERRLLTGIWERLNSRRWIDDPFIAHPSLYEGSFKPRQAEFKCEAGFLNVALRSSENKIQDIGLSGSFMFYPEEKLRNLESNLAECELSETELIERVSSFYLKENVRSPGISPMDVAYTILRASVEI